MAYRARVVVPFHTKFISTADLRAVGDEIKQRDPTVLWSPFEIKSPQSAAEFRQRDLPAMLIQFHASSPPLLPQFNGPRFGCMPIHKATQLKMLKEAGLPVPAWTRLEPKAEVDPAVFGEYLIIKPTDKKASLGRGITLIRTADFNAYRDRHAGEYVSEERSPPLVQQFIQTGDNPLHYRVLTFMERIVHSAILENKLKTPLLAPMNELKVTEGVASNTGDRRNLLFEDAQIFDLAKRAASVFDSVVVGVDILKSARTGELFVLEANMGNVWMFSSVLGNKARARLGLDAIRRQHDVFGTVADAVIDRVNSVLFSDQA